MISVSGRRIYLDANVLIGYVEDHPSIGEKLETLFAASAEASVGLVTSELTMAEVLVAPLRDGSHEMIAAYEEIMRPRPSFQVLPVDMKVIRRSAQLRVELGVKLPDAIHVATAMICGCEVFLTEDARLRAPQPITVCRVADLQVEESS